MKVKILKSGMFAHPNVSKPHVCLVEGEFEDFDIELAERLIECKWAESAEKATQEKEPIVEVKKPRRKKADK